MKNLDKETEENEVIENAEARDYYLLFKGSNPELTIKSWNYMSNLENFTDTLPGV